MKPRVLLVEDNQANRDLVRYLLEAHGFACDDAVDGETGVLKARTGRPDLVICDLQLPGIDGFEVLRLIRAEPGLAGVPVVALTAYAMVGDRERILGAGFDGYLPKPIDPRRFVGEIASFLRLDSGAPAPGAAGKRILVVDDRPANRELLASVLGYFGHTVVQADDGVAGMQAVREDRPDLVITDLLMPNMDGEEFCRQLRSDPATAGLPIIIHTASYRTRQGRQIADRLDVRWVLAKPSEPADIVAMVSQALGIEAAWPAVPLPVQEHAAAEGGDGAGAALASLQVRNERLTVLLENAIQIAGAQAQTLASHGLVREAQSLAQRLSSLVGVGLEMSFERDPDTLAEVLCRAAQDIMSARYIGVCLTGSDGRLVKFVSRGLDHRVHDQVAAGAAECPAARRLTGPGAAGRMVVAAKAGDFIGLPAAHPPVTTMIGCPVAVRDAEYGWIYAADRLGNEGFTVDDERLLLALGAQLASAWHGLREVEELDRRVAERTRELEAANAELEAFSSLVSHDLRSPLGNIGGYANALADKFAAHLPPDGARYIGKIEDNVRVMTALIEDLLHFARTSKAGIELRPCDLSALVSQCLEKFQDTIAQRRIKVVTAPLPVCRADSALMGQVLFNLIGNALKYTGHQQQPVVEVGMRREAGELVVFVKDNGVGFEMEFAAKLFNPFERLHSAAEFPGSGIGLALVKQIVSRHGGRVWAEAERGRGACFFFTLPLAGEHQ
ncbi:MAG: response regulator [Haliea sp.]|nr:MAG: response regulator [Haliea sp.]